ncbi:hypothetical protein Landi51_05978 [Colletotrichum acutatum]
MAPTLPRVDVVLAPRIDPLAGFGTRRLSCDIKPQPVSLPLPHEQAPNLASRKTDRALTATHAIPLASCCLDGCELGVQNVLPPPSRPRTRPRPLGARHTDGMPAWDHLLPSLLRAPLDGLGQHSHFL